MAPMRDDSVFSAVSISSSGLLIFSSTVSPVPPGVTLVSVPVNSSLVIVIASPWCR